MDGKAEKEMQAEGHEGAEVCFIGECPSTEDGKSGRLFSGRSGELFDHLLNDAGIARPLAYVSNVCKRPTFGGATAIRKSDPEYLEQSIALVRKEVDRIGPKIVVCLGAEAMAVFIGDRRVESRRGFPHWDGTRWILGTYNPAAILRSINLYPIVLHDFKKAKRLAGEPWLGDQRRITIAKSIAEIESGLSLMKREGRITFDIENTEEGIDCIGFADSPSHALVVPFMKEELNPQGLPYATSYWETEEEELQAWNLVKGILEDPSVEKCAQNAFYDTWHLQTQVGIRVSPVSFDTMLAAGLINSEFPKGLWFLTSLYTDDPFWEDEHESLNKARWEYNGKDVMTTFAIWQKQKEELNEIGLTGFYNRLPMPLLPCLVRASVAGVRFDKEERDRLLEEATRRCEEETQALRKITGSDINPNSHKQLSEYFVARKGLKPYINRTTKNASFSTESLERMSRKYGLPEFPHLIAIRRAQSSLKFLETEVSKDGRLRCSYNIAGTETGRLSSSEAPDRTGTNLQNVAPAMRSLIRADDSCYFIKADLKQAENIVVAYLADDPFMIKIIEEGGDIHTKIARMVFGHDEITKQERQLGKKIGHASNYGMGPFRLAEIVWEEEGVKITKAEAERLQADYFAAFPRIKLWHKAVQSTLGRTRKLTNPLGRTRAFLGYWGESLFKEGYAFLPQSTIADRVNQSFIELTEWGLDTRLQVHDEIVVNCPKEALHEQVGMVVQSLTAPFTINEHKVSIPVEVAFGERWGGCVPYTNDGSK